MPVRLSTYLKNKYGEKVYKLSLTSGCTCPNRDGTIGYGGCSFCSEGGSGEFAVDDIDKAKELIASKTDARRFIAYFQSFTNTYGDVERLTKLYKSALSREDVVALSIGTRPDCLGPEVMDMLKELRTLGDVWVELGLQTIHKDTAKRIRRGYELPVFEDAYRRLKEAGITVVVHVIFGLPVESPQDMLETIKYLSELTPELDGIKIQNLQILKGTDMYEEYLEDKRLGKNEFHIMSMEEYTELVKQAVALLPEDTVVHRMTGDGPKKILVEPLWSADKKRVMNNFAKNIKLR